MITFYFHQSPSDPKLKWGSHDQPLLWAMTNHFYFGSEGDSSCFGPGAWEIGQIELTGSSDLLVSSPEFAPPFFYFLFFLGFLFVFNSLGKNNDMFCWGPDFPAKVSCGFFVARSGSPRCQKPLKRA